MENSNKKIEVVKHSYEPGEAGDQLLLIVKGSLEDFKIETPLKAKKPLSIFILPDNNR